MRFFVSIKCFPLLTLGKLNQFHGHSTFRLIKLDSGGLGFRRFHFIVCLSRHSLGLPRFSSSFRICEIFKHLLFRQLPLRNASEESARQKAARTGAGGPRRTSDSRRDEQEDVHRRETVRYWRFRPNSHVHRRRKVASDGHEDRTGDERTATH